MEANLSQTDEFPDKMSTLLGWVADSPLFIDSNLLEQFYDAVVRPENKKGKTVIEVSKEKSKQRKGVVGAEVGIELKTEGLLQKILDFFPSIKVKGGLKASGELANGSKDQNKETVELFQIETPQRQLVHLLIYYLLKHPQRISIISKPDEEEWRSEREILDFPRQLVFLDLPSQREASNKGITDVKFIPTAGEFENNKIVLLYNAIEKDNGERPPSYPELDKRGSDGNIIDTPEKLYEERKSYWKWFDQYYNATKAMTIVEDAASNNGKIRWIDFRLPISKDGSTLHLHLSPAEKYVTGDMAYKLIKRGHKHGIRIIGTLKSGPSINVIAVFEK